MELISKVKISCFRSIKDDELTDMKSFTTLAGLNNSGKSNYIRALNLFFNGEVEPQLDFNFSRDYYRADIRKKRSKKKIKITVYFCIPHNFKFRKGLEEVKKLLLKNGHKEFAITKEWTRDQSYPNIYLNDQDESLSQPDREKIEQFLSLISFRYIPNRVLPIDIIKKEHQNLRDVLIRRVSKKKPYGSEEVFSEIAETSKRLIIDLHKDLKNIVPDFEDIRLDTPTSFSDMIFAFGYRLKEKGFEIEDTMQGSGIQSLLMFNTLYLIDKDYFQKFGWKQAAIWAIEEPESSLHFNLEVQVGEFLSKIANSQDNRLQVIATTHSEIVIQQSDKCYYVKKTPNGSECESEQISTILDKLSKEGVSGWQHPILKNPLKPLIIVEGEKDLEFFKKCSEFPEYKVFNKAQIYTLKDITLSGKDESGGIDAIIKYIKSNVKVIKNRNRKYPVIVILDWDAKGKANEIMNFFNVEDPIRVIVWDENKANPKLGKEFRGMERFLSDRIMDTIKNKHPEILMFNETTKKFVISSSYNELKDKASKLIREELKESDLEFARHILEQLANVIKET
jgi:predicted ATP-dependent endonuclease of OLD family